MAKLGKIKVTRDVATTFGTNLFSIGFSFVAGVVLARFLGPSGKGLFLLVFYVPGLLSSFVGLSFGQSILFFLRKERIQPQDTVMAVLIPVFILSFVTITGYLLLLPYLRTNILRTIDSDLTLLAIFTLPVMLLVNYVPKNVFRGLGRIRLSNIFSICQQVLMLCLPIIFIVFYGPTYRSAAYGYFAAYILLGVVILITLFVLSFPVSWKLKINDFLEMLKLGFQYHIVSVLIQMEYRLDILVIAMYLNPGQIGIYSLGVTIAKLPWAIANSVTNVMFPKISSSSRQAAIDFTVRATRISFYLTLFSAIGLIIFGYPLIYFAYGTDFIAAYFIVVILSIGIVNNSLFRTLGIYFSGIGQPMITARVSIITVILNVIFNFSLIPLWGINGAAITSAATYSISGLVIMFIFIRATNTNFSQFFVFQKEDKDFIKGRFLGFMKRFNLGSKKKF